MSSTETSTETLSLAANTVRMLSAESVEEAQSGHPGMPMGMAELGVALWLNQMTYNPEDPNWIARDRFVLSNGHGSMFLYSMLHLSGYPLSIDDLKQFRQWGSKTPGHPENFMTTGVETTTGPLGQGISNAVGLALGQKLLSTKYATADFNPVDHKVYCFCGDGCLMEGVSSEASSIAGHLGLDNLVVVYDDNEISIAGHTDLAFTEDVGKRYEAYGWKVIKADGHSFSEIASAFEEAKNSSGQPVIICARTVIGKGSPNKANTHGVHGAALGSDELAATKKNLGWPEDKPFFVPDEVANAFAVRTEALKAEYNEWQSSYSRWKGENPELAAGLEAQLAREVPADLAEKLYAAIPKDGKALATRKLSQIVLQEASKQVSALVGGSADLAPSTLTLIDDSTDIQKGAFDGLNIRFGVREHGMGAIMNGLAYYGGFIPYGATFMCFIDYMRPTVRLAALSHLQSLFIYTHDSVFLGEDGPTHQPVEHLATMRVIPNLHTYRPADGMETAYCYAMALERKDGPASMVLTRQGLEPFERPAAFVPNDIKKGAYAASDCDGNPDIVFVASGSEVSLALAAAKLIEGKAIRVVSMPCWEAFCQQDDAYRTKLIPTKAKKVVVEAGSTFGWQGIVGGCAEDTLLYGIDRFGASAPASRLAEEFGFTPEKLAKAVKDRF